jgi:hypothetical protein
MSAMKIEGVPPWDGEYPLDIGRSFNAREWHWIKDISGHNPLTVGDGFAAREPSLFIALSVIAMARAGKVDTKREWKVAADQLSEAPFDFDNEGAITLIATADDVEDVEEIPLDSTPTQDGPSLNVLRSSAG